MIQDCKMTISLSNDGEKVVTYENFYT